MLTLQVLSNKAGHKDNLKPKDKQKQANHYNRLSNHIRSSMLLGHSQPEHLGTSPIDVDKS